MSTGYLQQKLYITREKPAQENLSLSAGHASLSLTWWRHTKRPLWILYLAPHHNPPSFLLLFLLCYAKEIFILFLMWHVYKIFATVPSMSCEIAVYHCYFYDLHKCLLLFLQRPAKNCHLHNRFLLLSVSQPTKELNVTVLSVSCVLSSTTVPSVPMTEIFAFHALQNSSL
jgi:hypothetical protein